VGLLENIDLPIGLKNLTEQELYSVADECRNKIIEVVAENGGHLSPNLGVVELTVAIHASLESPKDKIIWDVGHQAYTHKLLTGRLNSFSTIRKTDGISGFPKRSESQHDIFGAGHAATSISAALGIAKARDIAGDKFTVLSVIGDASISSGEAFEAINNVHCIKGPFIVILNDNEMSISESVGVVSDHITSLRYNMLYRGFKKKAEALIKRLPKGEPLAVSIDKLITRTKHLLINYKKIGVIYEELGFRYLGPIDGYNIPHIMGAINYAKQAPEPVIIHILTKKGHGYPPAENDPTRFHGLGKFDPKTGEPLDKKNKITYTSVFGDKLVKLAQKDKKIVAITAAMEDGTGLCKFRSKFPERFIDVGMSEEHAVTFAAGLAVQGFKPVVAIYSTFMQRSFDQIIHDIALQNLPVVLVMDRAGLVGEDGPTHHGVFDIPFMRMIPNMTVLAPKDHKELEQMMDFAFKQSGPVSIRYPKGDVPNIDYAQTPIIKGKAEVLIDNKNAKVTVFACGSMVVPFYEIITEHNLNVNLINVRFIKPFDESTAKTFLKKSKFVITAEEGITSGGLYGIISEMIQREGISVKTKAVGINEDIFVEHGSKNDLFVRLEMDNVSIKKFLIKALEEEKC
jgi:1-deoxy-D-xylulose-5-phosphate synthase